MATTPTKNPIPSDSFVDARFNIEKVDEVISSDALSYDDRFGVKRLTINGVRAMFAALSKTYDTAELATSAITSGEIPPNAYFWIRNVDDNLVASEFQNLPSGISSTGKQVQSKFYYDKLRDNVTSSEKDIDAINNRIVIAPVDARKVPLWVDDADNVGVSLINGDIDAKGAGNNLTTDIRNSLGVDYPVIIDSSKMVPIVWDAQDNVAIWLSDGGLDAVRFGPNLSKFLGGSAPYSSASTLWRWRSKRAKFKFNANESLSVITTGDSWAEQRPISQALADFLYRDFGKKGHGWIPFGIKSSNAINTVQITNTGWTLYDADIDRNNGTPPPYGTGIDGTAIYTTGTAATLSFSVELSQVRIHYYDGSGSFNYSVDGGAPQTVTGGNTGADKSLVISGLPLAVHSISINTVGNSGVVCLYGANATSNATGGATLYQCGNGGTVTPNWKNILKYIPTYVAEFNPDVVVIFTGTNEVRTSQTVANYEAGLTDLVQAYKNASPTVGIILSFATQSGASGTTSFADFLAACKRVAASTNSEYISGYDLFSKDFKESQDAGLFVDSLHLNQIGGYMLSETIYQKMLAGEKL